MDTLSSIGFNINDIMFYGKIQPVIGGDDASQITLTDYEIDEDNLFIIVRLSEAITNKLSYKKKYYHMSVMFEDIVLQTRVEKLIKLVVDKSFFSAGETHELF